MTRDGDGPLLVEPGWIAEAKARGLCKGLAPGWVWARRGGDAFVAVNLRLVATIADGSIPGRRITWLYRDGENQMLEVYAPISDVLGRLSDAYSPG